MNNYMDTVEEIARFYGVPLPKVCRALRFKKETIFYWLQKNERWYLGLKIDSDFQGSQFFVKQALSNTKNGVWLEIEFDTILAAPQIHEIYNFHLENDTI